MKEYLKLTIVIAKHDGRVGGTTQSVQRATTQNRTARQEKEE